jgi:selenocysteine-specific elongation factor
LTDRQLTVGVLGHVDHGKTTLVKALTGTDTDRLEEEKRRGLSIVLGFAFLECDDGVIDFIDAPGHENFIRTMISGATGIDAVLLVIAADEGIKPQTREHFAIARLLGINQGLIVVNKSDLVDDSSLAAVQDEISKAMRSTFLEHAPIHTVSATSGAGLDELKQALAGIIAAKPPRPSTDTFYLPIDRVFTVDGVGTVGTGTLRSGGIRCEDEVEVMPSGLKANIREIQVHNQKVAEAVPGQRVAVNLRGVKREQLERGQVLIRPGALQETTCLHAKLQVLDDLPRLPKRNELIRLLFGTTEVFAKMRIVEDKPLESGASLLAQFRCRDAVFVSTGEHFIARTCSPVITFAGGEFLDTSEDLLQLPKEALVSHLRKLDQADVEAKIIAHIQVAGMRGIAKLTLAERATASGSQVDAVLEKSNAVSIDNTIAIDRSAYDGLCDKAIRELKDFHEKNPTATGQSLDIFRAACLEGSRTEVVDYVTGHLADTKQVEVIGNTVRLSEFNRDDNIDPSDREAINTIEQVFRDGGAATPFLDEVLGDDPSRKRAYQYLKDSGRLIALKDHGGTRFFVFHQETIEAIKKQLAETYPPPSNFTVSDFRVLTGSTRKYVIPMLEYFDRNRITIRQGNNRSLSRIEN